jgi:hypothetical protein
VESIRLIHALANELFVVCEEGRGTEPFAGGLVTCEYDSLTLLCADWIGRSEDERRAIAARGRTLALATAPDVRRALAAAGL